MTSAALNVPQQERSNEILDMLLLAFRGFQAKLWTALPGEVKDVSMLAGKMVVSVQPTIQVQVLGAGGALKWVDLPLLINVPVCFMSGGGFTLTMPVKVGAEALVIFASRCIDAWWQNGGVQQQIEFRMHELSDGFAIVGPRSLPNVLTGFNPDNCQLRSDDGLSYLELTPAHALNVVAPGGFNVVAPTSAFTGAITATQEVTSTLGGTHTLTQHIHAQRNDSGGNVEFPTDAPAG